jgi:hypothetical protein
MAKKLKFEFVTSTVSLLISPAGQADGIVVHVVNDTKQKQQATVVIYNNTGAGAVVSTDTGVVDIVPSWQWGLGFTIPNSGEYWVRISVSSADLIAKASFERIQNGIWVPVVSYLPGDFANFKLQPNRKRLWG